MCTDLTPMFTIHFRCNLSVCTLFRSFCAEVLWWNMYPTVQCIYHTALHRLCCYTIALTIIKEMPRCDLCACNVLTGIDVRLSQHTGRVRKKGNPDSIPDFSKLYKVCINMISSGHNITLALLYYVGWSFKYGHKWPFTKYLIKTCQK